MLRLSLLSGKASPLYPSILSSSLYRSGSTVLPSIVPIVSSLPLLLSSSSGSFIVRHLTSSSVRMYSASSTIYSSSSTATTPPVQFNGGKTLDETLVRKIGERDSAMRTAYDTVPKIYPVHAQPDDPITGQITNPIDQHIAFRKRLLYRSKQRGWLEVDLLMGTWAEKCLPTLSEAELFEYERILNSETIDLYNYITQRVPIPATLQNSKVLQNIQTFVSSAPLGRADPKAYEQIKKQMTN